VTPVWSQRRSHHPAPTPLPPSDPTLDSLSYYHPQLLSIHLLSDYSFVIFGLRVFFPGCRTALLPKSRRLPPSFKSPRSVAIEIVAFQWGTFCFSLHFLLFYARPFIKWISFWDVFFYLSFFFPFLSYTIVFSTNLMAGPFFTL